MHDHIIAAQQTFQSHHLRANGLIDLWKHGHNSLLLVAKAAVNSQSQPIDVMQLIGAMVLDAAAGQRVGINAVKPKLAGLIYEGVNRLAADRTNWNVEGEGMALDEFRAFKRDSSDALWLRRVQEMLGMHERKAWRFVAVKNDAIYATSDDMTTLFDPPANPALSILDVWSVVALIKATYSDGLFTVKRGPDGVTRSQWV